MQSNGIKMNSEQIEEYYKIVLDLVNQCGKVVRESQNVVVNTKEGSWDVVTQYDKLVEKILTQELKQKFPNHKFICEEDCSDKKKIPELTDDPTWFIDPIDGTTNFVHNFPINCISVGLAIEKESVIGVVFNPYLQELFTAVKGRGAFLNGIRISTSKIASIENSVINYELSLARSKSMQDMYLYRFKHLVSETQGMRSLGCAALGLCYVAKGCMDGYLVDGTNPWDIAAGALIVTEAGGFMSNSIGEEYDVMKDSVLAASTEKLGRQYVASIKRADEERSSSKQ